MELHFMSMKAFALSLCCLSFLFGLILPNTCSGEVYSIDEVIIEGTRRADPAAVHAAISAQGGTEISLDDIDRDIHAIFGLKRFVDVEAIIEERDGAQALIYRVTERPLVRSVFFAGNKKLAEDKLRPLVTLRAPSFHDPQMVDRSLSAIRQAYLEEGFYGAEVTTALEVSEENHEATLTFNIVEGDRVFIRNIRFQGNTVFTDRQLRKAMQTRERWMLSWLTRRGAYREEALQNDLDILADQYYNIGHIQVRVMQPVVTLSPDNKRMDILIEIEEGNQFRIGEIDLKGDLIRDREELLQRVKSTTGEVFSRQQLRTDVLALNSLYADEGYAYVNVTPLTHVDSEKRIINVFFDIEQGIQVSINRIRITGNTKTRDKVIRRELTLIEGDLYSSTRIAESRRRVYNLGFFEEVNVSTSRGDDEAAMNLDVDIQERPTGTFSVGVGYSSIDRVMAQGSVTQENFLGKALRLNVSASLGSRSTTYQVGIMDPYFLDTKLTLGFDLYKTEREWFDFTRKAFGGNIKAGYPLSPIWRTFFVYRYEEKEILRVSPTASFFIRDQAGRSTLSSIYGSLTRDTTDYRMEPSRGSVSEISSEFAGLGGTEKFAKYILNHRHFYSLGFGVFSAHGQMGYLQQIDGRRIPIDERFFLGGINTVRGFKTRQVGPRIRNDFLDQDGNIIASDFEFIGGNKHAFFNLEYVFPLIREAGLKGVIFFDTGNAWREGEQYFSDMRYSAGAGIRWFSPLGPLRLEWGYNLDPREFEDRSQFEFSIGRFF
jgi:outer membrane protein insertion porin family